MLTHPQVLEEDYLHKFDLYLISKQNRDALVASAVARNQVSSGDAVVLCFDERQGNDSSGAKEYEVCFIEKGEWIISKEGNIIRINMGVLNIQFFKVGKLDKTDNNFKIIQNALTLRHNFITTVHQRVEEEFKESVDVPSDDSAISSLIKVPRDNALEEILSFYQKKILKYKKQLVDEKNRYETMLEAHEMYSLQVESENAALLMMKQELDKFNKSAEAYKKYIQYHDNLLSNIFKVSVQEDFSKASLYTTLVDSIAGERCEVKVKEEQSIQTKEQLEKLINLVQKIIDSIQERYSLINKTSQTIYERIEACRDLIERMVSKQSGPPLFSNSLIFTEPFDKEQMPGNLVCTIETGIFESGFEKRGTLKFNQESTQLVPTNDYLDFKFKANNSNILQKDVRLTDIDFNTLSLRLFNKSVHVIIVNANEIAVIKDEKNKKFCVLYKLKNAKENMNFTIEESNDELFQILLTLDFDGNILIKSQDTQKTYIAIYKIVSHLETLKLKLYRIKRMLSEYRRSSDALKCSIDLMEKNLSEFEVQRKIITDKQRKLIAINQEMDFSYKNCLESYDQLFLKQQSHLCEFYLSTKKLSENLRKLLLELNELYQKINIETNFKKNANCDEDEHVNSCDLMRLCGSKYIENIQYIRKMTFYITDEHTRESVMENLKRFELTMKETTEFFLQFLKKSVVDLPVDTKQILQICHLSLKLEEVNERQSVEFWSEFRSRKYVIDLITQELLKSLSKSPEATRLCPLKEGSSIKPGCLAYQYALGLVAATTRSHAMVLTKSFSTNSNDSITHKEYELHLMNRKNLIFLTLPRIKGNAVILCPDGLEQSSGSEARKYDAYFVENGQWMKDKVGQLISITMGELKIDFCREGILTGIKDYAGIIKNAILKRNYIFPEKELIDIKLGIKD